MIQSFHFEEVIKLISYDSISIVCSLFFIGFMPLSINAETVANRLFNEITLNYFGRTLTHPGFKVGISSIALGNDTSGINWFVSFPLGIGYMRTFLDGKVYSVNNDGMVKREYFVGSNYFMPSAGLSFGYRWRKSRFSKIFLPTRLFWSISIQHIFASKHIR